MSRKNPAILLATLLASACAENTYAQAGQATPAPPPLRAESQIAKTIVFITLEVTQAGKPVELKGTGFLVGVPETRLGQDAVLTYLVTNRHVAEAIEQDDRGNCTPLPITRSYVTMNLREPVQGSRLDRQLLPTTGNSWKFPDDRAVDLAIIRISISFAKYDHLVIPSGDLLTPKELEQGRVVPGDKVLTAGYFTHYAGLRQIQPIVREGVLAMLPDGAMQTTTCGTGQLYLADVHVIPGNSGSPIFIMPVRPDSGIVIGGEQNTFGLLGIVSGFMQETEDLSLRASTTWKASVSANSGISVVVPAEQLKALLYSPQVQRERDALVARVLQQRQQQNPTASPAAASPKPK